MWSRLQSFFCFKRRLKLASDPTHQASVGKTLVLISTHFALEGILLWEVFKKERKTHWLQTRPYMFLILNLVAIIPDFDRSIGIHRGAVHSLFLAVMVLSITGLSYKFLIWRHGNGKSLKGIKDVGKVAHGIQLFLYAELLWIVHILLDLNTPLTLFWPLTDQTYQVNFLIVISVFPLVIFGILLLPYQILGIVTRVEQTSYVETLLMYISNMTVEQRTSHFGSTIGYLPVANIFFQLLIFTLWFLIVGRPVLKMSWRLYLAPRLRTLRRFNVMKTMLRRYLRQVHLDVLLFFVLLTSMGALMGVESHPTKEVAKYQGTRLFISSRTFKPLLGVDYERASQLIPPPHSDLEIRYIATHDHSVAITCECYVFLMPTTTSQQLYVSLASLFYQYNLSDTNERLEFENAYFSTVQEFIDRHPEYLVGKLPETSEKIQDNLMVNFSDKFVSLILILGKWHHVDLSITNDSILVSENVSLTTTLIHHHEPTYFIGLILQSSGFLGVLMTILVYPIIKMTKESRADRQSTDEANEP